MSAEGKAACVIGSGFGGLALAIRLQAAGVRTTIVEARDEPGGRAYHWRKHGFTFDAGPTVVTDPAALRELWELTGHDMAGDVELMPVAPFYRLSWPDGSVFDYSSDGQALRREIARFDAADIAGYDEFLSYSAGVFKEAYRKLGAMPFLDAMSMVEAVPGLVRHRAWQSVYEAVSKHIRSDKLRQAFSFHTLLIGGNPLTASAIYALIHKLEQGGGVWLAEHGDDLAPVEGIGALLRY